VQSPKTLILETKVSKTRKRALREALSAGTRAEQAQQHSNYENRQAWLIPPDPRNAQQAVDGE
jgi:hypothetical protein